MQAANLSSALQQPQVVDAKLANELSDGRLAGPFQTPPISPFVVLPLSVIPKETSCEFRLIYHLSFPKGSSVNDSISHNHSTVKYASIEDAICCIRFAAHFFFSFAKIDIQNALCIIAIQPDDNGPLGMQLHSAFFFDRCIPMGYARSFRTFKIFSTAD